MWRRCASISPCWSGSRLMVQTLPLDVWFSCQSGRDSGVRLGTVHPGMVNEYCVPRAVWDAGHLDWFFPVSLLGLSFS